MKTRKLIKFTALSVLALAVSSLSSCLKDPRFVNYAAAGATVELPLDASNGQFQPAAYNIVATPSLLPVIVNLASPSTMTTAITVTLQVNAAALAAYNTANGTSYTILPTSDYSISSLTVTIPAGQRTAQLSIMINSSLIDLSQAYILPITIASASNGIPVSIYNTLLYNVQAKNQYDGNYVSTGYVFHPSSPRAINATYHFATAGAAAVTIPFADLGASNYYFNATITSGTGVLTNYTPATSSVPPIPASGFMTADNPGGTAYTVTPGPGQAPYLSSTYNNTYVAATKTFWLHFGYASGGNGQNTFTRQFYMESVHQ